MYLRPGSIHDSNGARGSVLACLDLLWQALPGVTFEIRMDSAFFSDEIVTLLDELGVE
jgi:hypothetical protein